MLKPRFCYSTARFAVEHGDKAERQRAARLIDECLPLLAKAKEMGKDDEFRKRVGCLFESIFSSGELKYLDAEGVVWRGDLEPVCHIVEALLTKMVHPGSAWCVSQYLESCTYRMITQSPTTRFTVDDFTRVLTKMMLVDNSSTDEASRNEPATQEPSARNDNRSTRDDLNVLSGNQATMWDYLQNSVGQLKLCMKVLNDKVDTANSGRQSSGLKGDERKNDISQTRSDQRNHMFENGGRPVRNHPPRTPHRMSRAPAPRPLAVRCFRCFGPHLPYQCSFRMLRCFNCDRTGHSAKACRFWENSGKPLYGRQLAPMNRAREKPPRFQGRSREDAQVVGTPV